MRSEELDSTDSSSGQEDKSRLARSLLGAYVVSYEAWEEFSRHAITITSEFRRSVRLNSMMSMGVEADTAAKIAENWQARQSLPNGILQTLIEIDRSIASSPLVSSQRQEASFLLRRLRRCERKVVRNAAWLCTLVDCDSFRQPLIRLSKALQVSTGIGGDGQAMGPNWGEVNILRGELAAAIVTYLNMF